jgi:hypothetical protein
LCVALKGREKESEGEGKGKGEGEREKVRERGRKLTCIKFQLSIKLMPKTDVR